MNPQEYSPEERKDIEDRVEKAKVFLKELHLQPACWVTPVNVGDDVFALKTVAFIQDLKYSKVTSPLQKKDL